MKPVSVALVGLVVVLGSVGCGEDKNERVVVMTRNLYIGTDLTPITTATTAEEFALAVDAGLKQVAASNFPERAQSLADEIASQSPHLVALQEVWDLTLDGKNGPLPYRNYLDDLMAALEARGALYQIAAVVQDTHLEVPFPDVGLIGITDRDVILARYDVAAVPVSLASTGCRASLDGCNYDVIASFTSPVGEVAIERGFVVVDATIQRVGTVRFADTHLEEYDVDPTNPLSPAVQAAQAAQLVTVLGTLPNPSAAPLFLLGDFNSAPTDTVLTVDSQTIVPPYQQVTAAGYIDEWSLLPDSPSGYTCCQAPDLLNTQSLLDQRIDFIFSTTMPLGLEATLVGINLADRTPSGLWPSDHAGVVGKVVQPTAAPPPEIE